MAPIGYIFTEDSDSRAGFWLQIIFLCKSFYKGNVSDLERAMYSEEKLPLFSSETDNNRTLETKCTIGTVNVSIFYLSDSGTVHRCLGIRSAID